MYKIIQVSECTDGGAGPDLGAGVGAPEEALEAGGEPEAVGRVGRLEHAVMRLNWIGSGACSILLVSGVEFQISFKISLVASVCVVEKTTVEVKSKIEMRMLMKLARVL
jgi:hypothetical protein